jgi:hypothetical protein
MHWEKGEMQAVAMHGWLGRRNARHVIDDLGCDVIRSSAKCRRAERRVVQPLLGQPKVAQLHHSTNTACAG